MVGMGAAELPQVKNRGGTCARSEENRLRRDKCHSSLSHYVAYSTIRYFRMREATAAVEQKGCGRCQRRVGQKMANVGNALRRDGRERTQRAARAAGG